MNIEVEVKLLIESPLALRSKLESLGATLSGVDEQRDAYFNHPVRDFATTDEAVRLRRQQNDNCITYKGPKLDAATKTREEIEVPFEAGPSAYDSMACLLARLGFRPVLDIVKTRTSFELVFRGQQVQLAIDEPEGLGTYLEIEVLADAENVAAAKELIAALVVELELEQTIPERRSYLELQLMRKQG